MPIDTSNIKIVLDLPPTIELKPISINWPFDIKYGVTKISTTIPVDSGV